MSLTMPENEGGTFELCPEGNHVAVCATIIDLGTHTVKYENQPEKKQRKVYIGWQIPDELRSDGTPFWIGKRFTLSSHEKSTLRQSLESWRGVKFKDSDFGEGGFELKNVLGVGCMLNVVHSENGDRTFANIATLARLPKGMAAPAVVGEITYLSLEPDEFDPDTFASLSERMQQTVAESPEYKSVTRAPRTIQTAKIDETDYSESPF